ncbi:hypothetical protein SETIT_5G456000v2 [Setaria italica]|uniref:Uncharacterized protein n=1 Tax=Setaria italica TaxID=4555 RepID=A0A368RFW6_SETIT|nr:hypothetical protein SETIT_5G456000v2 [Setaria italica]
MASSRSEHAEAGKSVGGSLTTGKSEEALSSMDEASSPHRRPADASAGPDLASAVSGKMGRASILNCHAGVDCIAGVEGEAREDLRGGRISQERETRRLCELGQRVGRRSASGRRLGPQSHLRQQRRVLPHMAAAAPSTTAEPHGPATVGTQPHNVAGARSRRGLHLLLLGRMMEMPPLLTAHAAPVAVLVLRASSRGQPVHLGAAERGGHQHHPVRRHHLPGQRPADHLPAGTRQRHRERLRRRRRRGHRPLRRRQHGPGQGQHLEPPVQRHRGRGRGRGSQAQPDGGHRAAAAEHGHAHAAAARERGHRGDHVAARRELQHHGAHRALALQRHHHRRLGLVLGPWRTAPQLPPRHGLRRQRRRRGRLDQLRSGRCTLIGHRIDRTPHELIYRKQTFSWYSTANPHLSIPPSLRPHSRFAASRSPASLAAAPSAEKREATVGLGRARRSWKWGGGRDPGRWKEARGEASASGNALAPAAVWVKAARRSWRASVAKARVSCSRYSCTGGVGTATRSSSPNSDSERRQGSAVRQPGSGSRHGPDAVGKAAGERWPRVLALEICVARTGDEKKENRRE